ncbi:hypothetical protein [Streptococcus sp. LYSM12]|nr:hypothetical protein [Streptococcus sp. LYSM12]
MKAGHKVIILQQVQFLARTKELLRMAFLYLGFKMSIVLIVA